MKVFVTFVPEPLSCVNTATQEYDAPEAPLIVSCMPLTPFVAWSTRPTLVVVFAVQFVSVKLPCTLSKRS